MRARNGQGFILLLVLAMLVVLSLLAGTIAAATSRLRDQSQDRQRQLRDQIDIASTQATLYYLLGTKPMTIGGLTVDERLLVARARADAAGTELDFMALPLGNEISLDGSAFRGLGDIHFALQDDRGLFGINLQPADALQRLLQQPGAKATTSFGVLLNRLLDYQDEDDLYRLNSMEKEGYAKLGLPPPSNRALTTPMELMRIPGWREALTHLTTGEINNTISVDYTALINVNTAPVQVLMTLPGIDAESAKRVLTRRKIQPFLLDSDFYEFVGQTGSFGSAVSMYPSESGTLKLWSSRGGQVQLVHWTLTPSDDGGRPWREDYELIQSQDISDAGVALPVRSQLFAEPVAAQR